VILELAHWILVEEAVVAADNKVVEAAVVEEPVVEVVASLLELARQLLAGLYLELQIYNLREHSCDFVKTDELIFFEKLHN
jgi:hypothetical protein